MADLRRSTVYDFSSLRLHTNGTRVHQTSRNLRPRTSRISVQDARGNWIARDAGGVGYVGKYVNVRNEAQGDPSTPEDAHLERQESKGKEKAKERTTSVGWKPDERPANRQRFIHDLGFLETPSVDSPVQSDGKPRPSSDLLKCIHYLASTYYDERGQLYNASRQYRQQRKFNKLKQRERAQSVATSAAEEMEVEGYSDETSNAPDIKVRRGGKLKGGRVTYRKDMYRVMDGSALMAIGMLMQEYVAHLLEPRIPDGWEESVMKEYTASDPLSMNIGNDGDLEIGGEAYETDNIQNEHLIESEEEGISDDDAT